jgi:diketogulonate reductase-like aldo/keto reductase
MYGNEKEAGEAIRRSGLDRGDLFVTSKLNNDAHRPDDARRAFGESLKALGFDYLDLFLIHWPLPTRYGGDYASTWNDPTITAIARSAAKTPAQVVLRWHLQRGDIVFPKSVAHDRIRENIDIFDFRLSAEEVEAISALNRNERTGFDPDTVDWL